MNQQVKMTQKDICHRVIDYLTFIEDDFSIEKAVNDLYKTRLFLVEQGYEVPLLSTVFEKTFEAIELQGIHLDKDFVENFYDLILLKEAGETRGVSWAIPSVDHSPKIIEIKRKKKKKELQISDGVAMGFCKALAGGLLCIIPSGITQTIGTGLILSGVNDMVQHAQDPVNNGSVESKEADLSRRQRMSPENTSFISPIQVDSSSKIIHI